MKHRERGILRILNNYLKVAIVHLYKILILREANLIRFILNKDAKL